MLLRSLDMRPSRNKSEYMLRRNVYSLQLNGEPFLDDLNGYFWRNNLSPPSLTLWYCEDAIVLDWPVLKGPYQARIYAQHCCQNASRRHGRQSERGKTFDFGDFRRRYQVSQRRRELGNARKHKVLRVKE